MFGGKERLGRPGRPRRRPDGYFFRSRDRFSIAELNQFAVEYRGQFLDDAVTVNIGVRAPYLPAAS